MQDKDNVGQKRDDEYAGEQVCAGESVMVGFLQQLCGSYGVSESWRGIKLKAVASPGSVALMLLPACCFGFGTFVLRPRDGCNKTTVYFVPGQFSRKEIRDTRLCQQTARGSTDLLAQADVAGGWCGPRYRLPLLKTRC